MVFKTIKENVKSFFEKEESLLRDPKQVPETASEVFGTAATAAQTPYGETSSPEQSEKIVEHSLANNPSLVPSTGVENRPMFSSQSLRDALQKKRSQEADVEMHTAPETIVQPSNESTEVVQGALDADVRAFEEAISKVSQTHHVPAASEESVQAPLEAPITEAPPVRASPALTSSIPAGPSFFSTFEEFLTEEGIDTKHFDGDLLHKMRSFHERQTAGKEPLLHKKSANESLHRRLLELQSLEQEWQYAFVQSKDIGRKMVHIEEEIDEKTQALKSLLSESERLSALAQEASDDKAFVLANGKHARSIGGLMHYLQADPWLYDRHVSAKRNDFALWIEGVFDNTELAARLKAVNSLGEFLEELHKQLR